MNAVVQNYAIEMCLSQQSMYVRGDIVLKFERSRIEQELCNDLTDVASMGEKRIVSFCFQTPGHAVCTDTRRKEGFLLSGCDELHFVSIAMQRVSNLFKKNEITAGPGLHE